MIKIPVFKFQSSKSESGVTLLLAVLILSGMTLVTLAVAAFTIQEIRASRALILTEPAINAAESGAEAGLWALKRDTALAQCPSTNTVGLTSDSYVGFCKSYSGKNFDLLSGTPAIFYLFDPSDPNGNIDLLSYPYTSLTVTHTAGSFSVNVNVTRLDGTPVGSQPVVVNPGATQVINIPAVGAGTEGRMQVTMQAGGVVSVFADTNLGLPDSLDLDSTGCSSFTGLANCTPSGTEVYSRKIKVKL